MEKVFDTTDFEGRLNLSGFTNIEKGFTSKEFATKYPSEDFLVFEKSQIENYKQNVLRAIQEDQLQKGGNPFTSEKEDILEKAKQELGQLHKVRINDGPGLVREVYVMEKARKWNIGDTREMNGKKYVLKPAKSGTGRLSWIVVKDGEKTETKKEDSIKVGQKFIFEDGYDDDGNKVLREFKVEKKEGSGWRFSAPGTASFTAGEDWIKKNAKQSKSSEKKQDKIEDFELNGHTWKFQQGEDSASIENSDGTKYFAKPDESNEDFVDRVKKTIKEDFKKMKSRDQAEELEDPKETQYFEKIVGSKSVKDFFKELNEDPESFLDSKDSSVKSFLKTPIILEEKMVIIYSGAWQVPNPNETLSAIFLNENTDFSERLGELKEEAKKTNRATREIQEYEKNSEYQKSDAVTVKLKKTTFKNFLKKYVEVGGDQSHRSSLNSSSTKFKISRDEKGDSIKKSFDSESEDTLEKGVLDSFRYGQSKIDFKKKGSDIKTKLVIKQQELLNCIEKEQEHIVELEKDFIRLPTQSPDLWGERKTLKVNYKVFAWNQTYFAPEHAQTSMSIIGNNGEDCQACESKEEAEMNSKYNSCVYKIIDCMMDLRLIDLYLDSFEDNKDYTLTTEQMLELGF